MTKEHEPVWLTQILGCVTIYSRGYVNKLTGSEEDALEPGKEIYTLWGLCMKVVSKYYCREGDARLFLQGRD